jgi:hypothetical protein
MNMLRIPQINHENPYKMKIILISPSDFQFNPMFPDWRRYTFWEYEYNVEKVNTTASVV